MLSQEVAVLKEVVEAEFPGTKFIFLCCNNQVNARFYQQQGSKAVNPDRGIVIDTGCVKESLYDFYLVPHGSRTGLQGPTRFHLLYTNQQVNAKALYELTYRLCYGYFNYTSSVKVPSPVTYAHRLAYLIGEIENKHGLAMPKESLETKLYYI